MPFPFLCVQFNFGEVELWQYNGLYVSALRCFRSTVFQTTRVATSEFRFKYSSTLVESTVDQLVDWRLEKKQHMRWTKSGAQMLLHARCALINGELGKYTGWSPTDSSLEQAMAA